MLKDYQLFSHPDASNSQLSRARFPLGRSATETGVGLTSDQTSTLLQGEVKLQDLPCMKAGFMAPGRAFVNNREASWVILFHSTFQICIY